jgi:hypothetical protein
MESIYWSKEMYRIFGLDPGHKPPSYMEVVAGYTRRTRLITDLRPRRPFWTGPTLRPTFGFFCQTAGPGTFMWSDTR